MYISPAMPYGGKGEHLTVVPEIFAAITEWDFWNENILVDNKK